MGRNFGVTAVNAHTNWAVVAWLPGEAGTMDEQRHSVILAELGEVRL